MPPTPPTPAGPNACTCSMNHAISSTRARRGRSDITPTKSTPGCRSDSAVERGARHAHQSLRFLEVNEVDQEHGAQENGLHSSARSRRKRDAERVGVGERFLRQAAPFLHDAADDAAALTDL